MNNTLNPLEYARLCCDSMMKKFTPENLPPVGRFHYHQGVLLSGFEYTWKNAKDEAYLNYIKNWVDSILMPDGKFTLCHDRELDGIMPCVLLFNLYGVFKEPQYKIALDEAIEKLKKWDFTPDGGFWHMRHLSDQMWLDGFYMASPLLIRYALLNNDEELIKLVHKQLCLMRDNMRDEETGLFFHACDFSKKAVWADKETGLSSIFWGRAMGWYVVAATDIAEYLPENHPLRQDFIDVAVSLAKALAKYQEKTTGLWYQVVNMGDKADNWLESSSSALYTYAISKLVRLGWLDESYRANADLGYKGVIGTTEINKDGILSVSRICIGTCLGDYKFYVNRSTQVDMLIGVGAFLLMCNEYHMLTKE